MSDGMELFTAVKETLKNREEDILKMDKDLERVRSLCSSLLSSLERQMRGGTMSYDERKGIENDTKVLCSRIDSEVEIHNHCQEELMKYEEEKVEMEEKGSLVR